MENFLEKIGLKLFIFLSRIVVIGFFAFWYVTTYFILFYLIIFNNLDLFNKITIKYYLISYFIGCLFLYKKYVKDEKPNE
jgi:hypothetical protein